jgi:Bacterial protein of unknown function (DUF899)
MPVTQTLSPAPKLAAANTAHFPNESEEYRIARNGLLVEEIELRRQIERVAARGARCPMVARSRRTSNSSPRLVPFASPASLEIRTR